MLEGRKIFNMGIHTQSSRSQTETAAVFRSKAPPRLKPLDLQKRCGEVMIGALIGASHWGLKAHPLHMSLLAAATNTPLPTHTKMHLGAVEEEQEDSLQI